MPDMSVTDFRDGWSLELDDVLVDYNNRLNDFMPTKHSVLNIKLRPFMFGGYIKHTCQSMMILIISTDRCTLLILYIEEQRKFNWCSSVHFNTTRVHSNI